MSVMLVMSRLAVVSVMLRSDKASVFVQSAVVDSFSAYKRASTWRRLGTVYNIGHG